MDKELNGAIFKDKEGKEFVGGEVVKQPEYKMVVGNPEITNQVKEIFDDWQQNYSEAKVGYGHTGGFEAEDKKELAIKRTEEVSEQMKKMLGENGVDNKNAYKNPLKYSEGMAVLSFHYGNCLDNQLDGYKRQPEDMQEEIKARDKKVDKLFLEAGKTLFPDAKKPANKSEAITSLKDLSETKFGNPLLEQKLDALFRNSDDTKHLLKVFEIVMSDIANELGAGADSVMRGEDGEESGVPERLLEAEKVLYQLRMIRDTLTKSEYGVEGLDPEKRREIDELKNNIDNS